MKRALIVIAVIFFSQADPQSEAQVPPVEEEVKLAGKGELASAAAALKLERSEAAALETKTVTEELLAVEFDAAIQEARAKIREALKAERPEFQELRENFREALPELMEQLKDQARKLREEQKQLAAAARGRPRE